MAWALKQHQDFTGGENRKLLQEYVKDNQVIYGINCVLTPEGFLQTREGKTKVNTSSLGAGAVLGVWRWGKENGTHYLTVQHGTSLYNTTWDGTSQISSFGAAVKTGLTAAVKLRGKVWKDNLILSNGVDAPFRFDGSACTNLGGSPPLFKIFTVYGGRLWVVPMSNLNCVQSSGLEDYDVWNALDIYKIRTGDGDTLTGLFGLDSGLFISKLNTVWGLYGTNRFDINVTNDPIKDIGCVSHDAIMDVGIFLAKDNLYQFNLNSVTPFPDTHSNIITSLSLTDKKASFGVVDSLNKRVIIQVNNDYIFCIDGRYGGAITSWKKLNANCFIYSKGANDTGVILIGDATNGWIYKLSGTSDDGTNIETLIKTPYLNYDSLRDKVWRRYTPDISIMDETNYQFFCRYDVDYKKMYGSNQYQGYFPDYLEWDIDSWDMSYWTADNPNVSLSPYFLHEARGKRISFEIKSDYRIKYRGHIVKYREAGIL